MRFSPPRFGLVADPWVDSSGGLTALSKDIPANPECHANVSS